MSRIVFALGGNALGNTAEEQLEKTHNVASAIAGIILEGHEVIIAHGNGPQVGMIGLAFEKGSQEGITPFMPLPECTAMSQGYIGYHLQQSIDAELVARGRKDIPVITILTQVIIDENDPAFQNPTKPIGAYYNEETAKRLAEETGYIYKEDAGRGWRRVVPSPKPVDIYEKKSLACLIQNKQVVIACGGGGIPIALRNGRYAGIPAVIDKDFAAAKLAALVEADLLCILTAVDRVSINFRKPDEKELSHMTVQEAKAYCEEGHFAPGSMLPKVQAAIDFAESGPGRTALIASLDKAEQALHGDSGTKIEI